MTQRPAPAPSRLTVLIVGAGLGGLACAISVQLAGHQAIVFESASKLGEIGAGIQLLPNVTRILDSWGLGEELAKTSVHPRTIWFRRWQDGKKIAKTPLVPDFEQRFGAKYYVAHRAHLHEALHRKALALGAEVHVDHRVVDIEFETPRLLFADGSSAQGDLIVGADGIKSTIRSRLLRNPKDGPTRTPFCAYRALVPCDKMRSDTELATLLEANEMNVWIGKDVHCMSYQVAQGKMFNLVLSHKDTRDASDWPTEREEVLKDLRSHFEGWDPLLNKVLSLVETGLKWPLSTYDCMASWSAPSQRLVLLGDACHAMLPYMSAGAAMAIEDAATLGRCLALAPSIPSAIKAYESLRIPRAREVQERAAENGKRWHFADGPDQIARDEGARAEVEGRPFTESTNQWSDPKVANWLYGYDCKRAVDEYFSSRINGHA